MIKHRLKYVAEGFVQDSSKLINDFLKLNSVEFEDFATVWRKHSFSLIFMGRPDATENSEFVNEIFRLSTQYFMEESFHTHVGAVYLLYGLFENQMSRDHPPIKIRLEMKHFDAIKSLRSEALKKNIQSLHYVIEYLIENAFHYVANQTLRGPLIAGIPTHLDVIINQRKEECAENLEDYCKTNYLEKLRVFHKEYIEAKKKITECASLTLITENRIYEDAIEKLENMGVSQKYGEKAADIGGTRAKIKAEAFKKKAKKRYTVMTEDLDNPVIGSCSKDGRVKKPEDRVKEVKVPKRPRKEDKRPGRPSQKPKPRSPSPEKNSSDEEIDITHLLTQQKALYAPQTFGRSRASKCKRDPYYQVSPKRVESSSESEADKPK